MNPVNTDRNRKNLLKMIEALDLIAGNPRLTGEQLRKATEDALNTHVLGPGSGAERAIFDAIDDLKSVLAPNDIRDEKSLCWARCRIAQFTYQVRQYLEES
jgi:hypothetical protein